ncbi:phage portal protein [Streptomyces sp. NPDC005302]|uniref:phage portal protein n=1 Tax=Streptomyces sp. NPDC005302 TaxID=3154675 RepID=UPI0033A2ED46
MPIDASKVESPGWWLQRLGKKLLDEVDDAVDADGETEPGLETLRRFAENKAPLPKVPGVDPREARDWMRDARTNWTSLVIDSPVERMHVDGFRFGTPDSNAKDATKGDSDANRVWQENALDADADLIHYGALSQRRSFALVERGDDGRPVITHETPRQVAVEHEQGNRRRLAAGLKLWRDDWTGDTRATLWTPEKIYDFVTKTQRPQFSGSAASLRSWDAFTLPNTADGERANDLDMVPLVPFINRRNRRISGFAEHEDVLTIQNRINLSLINLIAAMKYGAFRQRYASGLEVDEDPITGQKLQPYKLDIKSLWTSGDPETKFGEFAATDLKPYVSAVQAAVQDLAAISRTPPHYLIGAVVNVSGDALKAAETGLISKVRDRQRTFGESWEQTMRLAFRVLGDEAKATAFHAETIWRDPESRSVSELADAAVKKEAAGVPWRQRMEDMGYTPTQIARMEVDRAEDAINAQAVADATAPKVTNLDDARAKRDQRPVIGRGDSDPVAA